VNLIIPWPLDKASDHQLADLLSSSYGTVRDLAHRMLFWKYVTNVTSAKANAETPKGLNNQAQGRAAQRSAPWVTTSLGTLNPPRELHVVWVVGAN